MGKISDALDRIDSLEEIGIVDPRPGNDQIEESIPPETSSVIAIKKDVNSVEVNGKWDDRLFKAVNYNSKMVEVFKILKSKILHPPDGRHPPKSIMVSSSIRKEGKSFITANLGVSIANTMDRHCLLVDCDLRHPTLAQSLGINPKYGLADYLRDQVELADVIVKTPLQMLSVLPSGVVPENPAELLSSSRMHAFYDEISNMYEDSIIVFDSPAMFIAAESMVLAGKVDAIILVVRQGRAKNTEVQRFVDAVDETKILGIVFNDLPR